MKHYMFTIEFNAPDLTRDDERRLYLRGKELMQQFESEFADILDGANVDFCLMSKSKIDAERAN